MQSGRSCPLITVQSNIKSAPKWSFKGKPRDGRKNETPGPGSYGGTSETTSKFARTPNFGFGGSTRDLQRPYSAPGPGQYQPDNPNIVSSKYGFGTSTRKGSERHRDQPGPGTYRIEPELGKTSPKYTANKRREMTMTIDSPGPGAYQPNDSWSSAQKVEPKYGFGTSPREGRRENNAPGPGQYNVDRDVGGAKYSMRSRGEVVRPNTTPGPGAHGGMYTQFG